MNIYLMRTQVVSALAFTLVACDAVDTMQKGFAHSQAVAATIEKETGLKSTVGFQWHNGALSTVTINFDEVSDKPKLSELSEIAKKAVTAEFKQKPDRVILAFVVTQ